MLSFNEIMILTIVIFSMITVTIYFLKNVQPKAKKSRRKSIDDSIDNTLEQRFQHLEESHNLEVEMLKKDKQRQHIKLNQLTTKYNKLLDELEESDELDEDDTREEQEENNSDTDFFKEFEIIPEKAMKYAKDLGLDPQGLSNPALQPIIMEKLKENKEVALALGIIKPRGIGGAITPATTPASSQSDLIASLTSQSNMA